MGSSDELRRLRLQALGSRALLVTLFVLFAWANLRHWQDTGKPSGLGTTALEAWAAVLFLTRRADRAREPERRRVDRSPDR